MTHKIKYWFSSYFIFFISLCSGENFEIETMDDIYSHITKECLVIFDIDNTLLEPAQELGNDQWFYARLNYYKKKGLNHTIALDKALSEWHSIQNVTKVTPVENHTYSIVASLQDKGQTIMGLTTRGLGLSTRTIEQLHCLNFDLTKTAPTSHEIFFWNGQGVLFKGGVLFTAGTHKGKALKKFLDQIGYKPKKIVFINDKASHLKDVEEFCTARNIPFAGLRYGHLDKKVKNFREDIAQIQWEQFGKIISDQEALEILNKNNLSTIAK